MPHALKSLKTLRGRLRRHQKRVSTLKVLSGLRAFFVIKLSSLIRDVRKLRQRVDIGRSVFGC